VRLVVEATVAVLRRRSLTGEVLVSYDTRLLSEKFAREAVGVLTHHGFRAVMSERDLPTPCLAFAVRERGGALGIMFTASHNPADYNGIKPLHPARHAGAARAHRRDRKGDRPSRRRLRRLLRSAASPRLHGPAHRRVPRQPRAQLDWEAIRRSGMVVAVDPLFARLASSSTAS